LSGLKEMKICFLAGTLGQGGAERQLFYQVSALQRVGALPFIVAFAQDEFWEGRLKALGIPVYALPVQSRQLKRLWFAAKIIRRERPVVIQAAHFYVNLYAWLLARLLGSRELGAVRSNGFQDVSEMGRWSGRGSLLFPRILAVNSRAGLDNLEKMGRARQSMVYLPNVVDAERFFPADQAPADAQRLIMVGRMSEPKRFDLFLRIVAELNGQGLPVMGHLVGDGPLRPALERLALDLGLGPDRARFHGAVENAEVLFRQARLCLHISDWEGMPNTALEAMACGLPVIASRVGGLAELIQDEKTGYLISPGDFEDLLASVVRLIRDEGLRRSMGRQAREYVLKQHDLSMLPDRLLEIYRAAGV